MKKTYSKKGLIATIDPKDIIERAEETDVVAEQLSLSIKQTLVGIEDDIVSGSIDSVARCIFELFSDREINLVELTKESGVEMGAVKIILFALVHVGSLNSTFAPFCPHCKLIIGTIQQSVKEVPEVNTCYSCGCEVHKRDDNLVIGFWLTSINLFAYKRDLSFSLERKRIELNCGGNKDN